MSQAIQPADAGGRSSSFWSNTVPTDLRPLGGSERTFSGRLASYGNPTLVAILGAEHRAGALLVMSELDDGLPLGELMSRSSLSPSQVISVGLDVLTGLQALQQLGLSHGNLHAGN